MPYIPEDKQGYLSEVTYGAENAGELNFVITTIVWDYMKRKGIKYQNFNDVIGALEGSKLELYRRQIAPYEDKKIKENGDVFD